MTDAGLFETLLFSLSMIGYHAAVGHVMLKFHQVQCLIRAVVEFSIIFGNALFLLVSSLQDKLVFLYVRTAPSHYKHQKVQEKHVRCYYSVPSRRIFCPLL